MKREALREGDTIKVKLPYHQHPFEAKVTGFDGCNVLIDPIPIWPTWRRIRLTDIEERVDPPPRKRRRRCRRTAA